MDVMNVLNPGTVMGNVAQLTNTNSSSTNATSFQKQLVSLVEGQQGDAGQTAETGQMVASSALLLAGKAGSLNEEQASAEQLNALLEGLLDQLDELEQLGLDNEQQSVVEDLIQQMEALIQVVSFNQEASKQAPMLSVDQQLDSDAQQSSSNQLVIKLQDQLLMLQHALQSGEVKVLPGFQSVEDIVTEQLHIVQATVAQLLQDAKLKQAAGTIDSSNTIADDMAQIIKSAATDQATNNKAAESQQDLKLNQAVGQQNASGAASASEFAVKDKSASDEQASHLQRLNVEATYAQAATQANDASNSATQAVQEDTTVQPSATIAQLRADNVRELLPHFIRTGPSVTSAYVLADEFADTMRGLIVQRFNVTELNGLTEARLSLTPEHLGHVDVKISMQNGVLTAMFQTETAMAKDALENQMLQLRASLAAQGITVEKIEVAQTEFASQLSQQQKQQSNSQNGNDDSSRKELDEAAFEEELLINAANQELGFGRAVNETV